ncbi:MAG: SulP family inorganic anion transporter [Myxococcales bacterium]|nr:SulP family inorganic anion transporter [Myxococcales bacterium]
MSADENMFKHLKSDLPASIVVFFVAVPLCLGIALASDVPLFAGLIAGIVGGIVVGAASGSALGVSGPAAGLVVIVLSAKADLGSFEAFLLALVFAGLIQIALGLLRAGVIAYFFPSSVIKGMLAGIGVIIFLKQIPHAFGHDSDPEGDMAFAQVDGDNTLHALTSMLGDLNMSAIVITAVSLLILVLWERVLVKKHVFFRIVQGPLVAVAFGIAWQAITSASGSSWALASSHLVSVPVATNTTEFMSNFAFPDWSFVTDSRIYVAAMTIAIVASLETLLCVEATDKLDPRKRVTPTNRELIAQGIGNTVSGLIGGLPVTQVIVRSSANIQSGGVTKMSAILHGFFLLFSVIVLPQVLNMVPLAVLAAILLLVGYKLARPELFKAMAAKGHEQFVPFVVTIVGIVLTDLLSGIAMGMVVAIVFILLRNYRKSHFLHMEESDEGNVHCVRVHFAEEVTFLNKGAVTRALDEIPDGCKVVIDASDSYFVDFDVLEIIEEFIVSAQNREIEVEYRRKGSKAA